jgi:hypothetical protein
MRPQTAFHIHYDGIRHGSYSVDAEPQSVLPQVKCDICGESESTQNAWYPTLHPHIREIKNLLSELVGDAEIVSSECFRKVRSRICKLADRELWLPGGSELGAFKVVMKSFHRPKKLQEKFKKLPDLLDCAWNYLISRKALHALRTKGFEIPCGPTALTWNGLLREDYLAVELEPRTVFAPSGRRAWESWTCDFCGGSHLKQPVPKRRLFEPVEYDANAFPEHVGILRVREGGMLLASEDFKAAVEELGLTGFKFIQSGTFVNVA